MCSWDREGGWGGSCWEHLQSFLRILAAQGITEADIPRNAAEAPWRALWKEGASGQALRGHCGVPAVASLPPPSPGPA